MSENPMNVLEGSPDHERVVFLHGWCGHADEVESIRPSLPGRVLGLSWTPPGGSLELEAWPGKDRDPGEAEGAMRNFADNVMRQVRQRILDAGFAGATLIGHSLGGALSCMLANDPELAVKRVILLDSSTPMPAVRRTERIGKMTEWVDRAADAGRLMAQAAWIAEASTWIPDFFSLEDQGSDRLRIERRFMFAPAPEAAMMLGGAVQWPIDESIRSMPCELHALAGDPGLLMVESLQALRPDARIEVCEGTGHYPHVFAPGRTRDWLQAAFTSD
jgi:pimeloyl-ACP methyl ester carboxylesterase